MMDPRVTYCTPFFVAAMLIFIVFLYTCRRLKVRGAWYLALVCVAASVWASSEGMLYLDLDFETKIHLTKFQYLGIAPIPPLALLFGLSVFGFKSWTSGRKRFLLFFITGIIILLVWTNSLHRLVFTDYHTIQTGPFPMLGLKHGPLWWVVVAYHYFLVTMLSIILLQKVFISAGFQRSQAGVMLAAVVSVWIANAVYITGNSPVPNMDIGPIAFTLVAGSMAWGFFRYNLLDILPVARAEIFHGIDDAILVFDEKNRVIDINPAAESIFQIVASETIGQRARPVFAQHSELLKIIEKTNPTETNMALDVEDRVYDVRVSCLSGSKGGRLGLVIALRDITEHKHAQGLLRESEERFRQIFNIAPAGIYEVDYRTGKIVSVNDAICEYTGYTKDELLSMNPLNFLTEESQTRFLNRLDKILKGKRVPQTVEYTAIRKDGVEFMLSINTRFLYENEKIIGATVVAQDITDRKQARKALKHSEERYRSLVENTMDGYFICEIPSGQFLFLNQRACDFFGYTMEEGLNIAVWDVISSEDHERVIERIQARFIGKPLGAEIKTYTAIRKDGSTFRVEISTSLVTYREGQAVQGLIRDITEKERLENQLQHAQKMEAIGTLAGGIAHDFNNILMGIQGRASLLMTEISTGHPHYDHLDGIEEYVKSAADLTKQLLGFARGGKYEVLPTNLNDIIDQTGKMFGRTKKEIRIEKLYEDQLWTVDVDRKQIEQVLLNLFVNAWQAMPGGGTLFLQTENREVDDNYAMRFQAKSGKYAKVSVTDTGDGIDDTTKQRIFEPFFTTKERGRGTGLGLASCYGIIQNHNGFINVDSKKDQGATFSIFLPASDKMVVKESKGASRTISGQGTILFVDDETMILEVAKPMLEKLGYRVYSARNGNEAIELFKKKWTDLDLVILDMIMPGFGGGEVFDRMKEIDPDVRVLLSSGYSINGQATEIMNRGCAGFIQKPFNISEISENIKNILDAT